MSILSTYDIYVGAANTDPPGKPMTFGFKAAVSVTGPTKMVSRWIKCFMTLKGSDHADIAYGTGFVGLLGGNIADQQDMLDQVSVFISDCNAQMTEMDQVNLPIPDEQFGSAVLTKVTEIDPSNYQLWVSITSASGVRATIPLPSVTV